MARRLSAKLFGPALVGLALLAGCDMPLRESLKPQARPSGLIPRPAPQVPKPKGPSKASVELTAHYARLQQHLLAQGLLRRDGGGPDTQFRAADLARNFEAIAFYDEHAAGVLSSSSGTLTRFHRWEGEARVAAAFGSSLTGARKGQDTAMLNAYLGRLARVTGRPIAASGPKNANFLVLFMGQDDSADLRRAVRAFWPDFPEAELSKLTALPRDVYCLVHSNIPMADAGSERAVAVIRAEHPDLMRLSCIHEEVAQGLGLPSDSPYARPSIFNDDEEFATLTSHDELLLKMLYDPRLKEGMSLTQARPIFTQIAAELTGEIGS